MGEASFGKYRLIAELGHGGMADVFLAVQAGPVGSNFRKLSVIKRLRQNLVEEPEFVEMLIEEARIAARLNHPNVVQTNEVGEVDQQYFIAMEYLDGQPLHRIQHRTTQRVKDGKVAPITPENQMVVVMDALAGLHHAHELADYDGSPLQIVHRDVTPQNIFVTYEGQVKVVDFGIAKAAGRASETRQGVVKGKVRYMAPEQALGHPVDRRADVFSMGIMLWEVATGRRMWKGVDDLEIVRQLVDGSHPRSPRALAPHVHVELDRICSRALANDREERYASADDFRADLEQFLADTSQLVEARRRLAPAIAELFQDKRDEIRAVIERQLATLAVQDSGELKAISMPPDSISNAAQFAHSISPPAVASTGAIAALPDHAATRRRLRNATIAGVVAALACASALALWRTSTERASASLVAPAVEEITLRFRATPDGTTVSVDDGAPTRAPVELKVPKDGRDHRVRFEADGFLPRTEAMRFGGDLAVSVALQPMPTSAAVPAARAHAASPASAAAPPKGAAAPVVAAVVPPPPPVVAEEPVAAPTTPSEMPIKEKKKPKTELDNGDPWATK